MMGSSSMIVPPVPGGSGGGNNPYFIQQQELFHAHQLEGIVMDDGGGAFIEPDTHCHALLYNLSVLKDKVQQLQPLVRLAVAHDDGPVVAASSGASAVIQEIISAASSMMYAFQQLYCHTPADQQAVVVSGGHYYKPENNNSGDQQMQADVTVMPHQQRQSLQQHQQQYGDRQQMTAVASTSSSTTTIIELDAGELLAKYTHYCQVCGKGFKRDANLRMHMRAHGDEYKSSAALMANKQQTAPMKSSYYSCPQEGCRWNRKHAKFQPLKSVICAKNHYKRSHCPKMYVCNRCNLKHFSVLSDLLTHEKHCGDHRWLCSCGTSFSRKDKLIGHLALFAGHHPAVPLDNRHGGKRSSAQQHAVS